MVFKRLNIDALKRQAPIPANARGEGQAVPFLDARTRAETVAEAVAAERRRQTPDAPKEHGGPKGLEPTRYGDWEKAGRCFDF